VWGNRPTAQRLSGIRLIEDYIGGFIAIGARMPHIQNHVMNIIVTITTKE
jgi:hypothetical protein